MADFLRALRSQSGLIIVVAVVCAGAALGISLHQQASYSAQASLSISDPSQGLTLLGTSVSPETPNELAAAYVQQVTRPSVARSVKADLHTSLTEDQLDNSVAVSVDPSSNLVLIEATAPRAAEAAAIANAFAREAAKQSNNEARQTFATEASNLEAKTRSRGQAARLALSQLQLLSAAADPVNISSTAGVPGAPSSPKPFTNTLAGLIIGLVLGIAIAYGRQAADKRLRRPEEAGEHLGLPLLGNVRNEALGHAGPMSNGRGPLAEADLEGFRILRQNVDFLEADEKSRCIAVTSALAAEGKSTVAAGLAFASAGVGKRTLLLECDLHRPVLAKRMGLAAIPGLTEYLTGSASPQEVLQIVQTPVSAKISGNGEASATSPTAVRGTELVCITAGAVPPSPANLLASARFRDLLMEVREAYDVVIIDCPPLLPVVDAREFVPYVSSVIVCARCDQTTRDQARAVKAALDRLPPKPAGAVVTGIRRSPDSYYMYD